MGGTTPSQGLRFPYVDDVITDAAQGNLGADIAAKLTTQDAARAAVLQRPRVLVSRSSTNQTLTSGTDTAIIWDTVGIDPGGLVNLGLNPTRITPGSANVGVWNYSVASRFITGTITKIQFSVKVTGTVKTMRTWNGTGLSTYGFVSSGSVVIPAGTDYMELFVTLIGTSPTFGGQITAWQASA